MICGETRPPASTGRALRVQAFCPVGKTLMPGEFSSPEQMKETLGGPRAASRTGDGGRAHRGADQYHAGEEGQRDQISNRREIVVADAHIGPLPRPCAIRRAGVGTRPYKTTEVTL